MNNAMLDVRCSDSSLAFLDGGFAKAFGDEFQFVVVESLLIQPVRAGDFPEGVNRCLDAFGPGDRDQFDVSVHVSDGEDASAAGFKVRVDGDDSVIVECQSEPVEKVIV
jgi:hypothetical protein